MPLKKQRLEVYIVDLNKVNPFHRAVVRLAIGCLSVCRIFPTHLDKYLTKYVGSHSPGEISSPHNQKPLLATGGLLSCVGIAIYDPQTKIGGIAHILFEEQGPSSSKFDLFKKFVLSLIEKADGAGGNRYILYTFNAQKGYRTDAESKRLLEVIEDTIKTLVSENKLLQHSYKDETGFVLDTRNGEITPY